MKLIVAGTRTFDDYQLLCDRLDFYLSNVHEEIEIVSGGNRGKTVEEYVDGVFRREYRRGADQLGEMYAGERGYLLRIFEADWALHGNAAGPIRNGHMAEYATHATIFWDGRSKGSKGMIELCKLHRLNYRVVKYLEVQNGAIA